MEILEQPIMSNFEDSQNQNLNESGIESEIIECQDNEKNFQNCEVDGSNLLGKFNDVNELVKAYNNLQAEFTRKCQKLSSLEKEVENNKNKDDSLNQIQSEKPSYMEENFNETLTNFLAENPNAKQYSKEISLAIIEDGNLSLSQAYERVLAKKFKEPEELLQDENFIQNYILTNENLKKELLKEYVKSVKESSTPHLISGNSGISGSSTKIEISSLEEANKLALKLFKS